jgi:hypothetical protein
MLDGAVAQQAAMVSYVDVFHLMFIDTLAMIPLVMLLKKPNDQITGPRPMPAEH